MDSLRFLGSILEPHSDFICSNLFNYFYFSCEYCTPRFQLFYIFIESNSCLEYISYNKKKSCKRRSDWYNEQLFKLFYLSICTLFCIIFLFYLFISFLTLMNLKKQNYEYSLICSLLDKYIQMTVENNYSIRLCIQSNIHIKKFLKAL